MKLGVVVVSVDPPDIPSSTGVLLAGESRQVTWFHSSDGMR